MTDCDQAAGEQCPYWPGQPLTARWGVEDPSAVQGSDEEKRRAFMTAYARLRRRIELFVNLPVASLDRMTLKKSMEEIGTA